MDRQSFTIRGRLAGLNEYTAACRRNRYSGAKLKREQQDIALAAIEAADLVNVRRKVDVSFTWIEPNMRRDHDNVAFAKKFILDALVEAGVLENDDPRHVGNFADYFKVNRDDPRVIVALEAAL